MLTRLLRTATITFVLGALFAGLFIGYRLVSDLARGPEPQDLALERCPASSESSFFQYTSEAGRLMTEALRYEEGTVSYTELVQKFSGLYARHRELSYPECAAYLHHLTSEAFRMRALEYSAKAQGGVIGEAKALFYYTESVNKLYLVPFVIRMITPPAPPPPGLFQSA